MKPAALFARKIILAVAIVGGVPVQAEQSPIFIEFQNAGMARGDRGDGQANRFEPFLATYRGFAPASQDFILRAFSAGKLTEAPEGQGLDYANCSATNKLRIQRQSR
jgi:hypothetical protein